MYGIPNMKLDKEKVLRRVDMLREEGEDRGKGGREGGRDDMVGHYPPPCLLHGTCC